MNQTLILGVGVFGREILSETSIAFSSRLLYFLSCDFFVVVVFGFPMIFFFKLYLISRVERRKMGTLAIIFTKVQN